MNIATGVCCFKDHRIAAGHENSCEVWARLMPEQGPAVAIYLNRRTGQFSVQSYARHFSTPQPFGAPTILPSSVTDAELLQIILGALPKTETQKYELSLAPRYSPEERRRRLREEQLIGIRLLATGFEVAPFRRMGNSFGSIEDMTQIFSADEFLSRGGEIVRQLFQAMS